MSIKLHLPESLAAITKGKLLYDVKGSTVGECLNNLIGLVPKIKQALFYETGKSLEDGDLLPIVAVLVDEESSQGESLVKKVRDGDEIFIKTNFR